jgi:hypothetical protein
MGVSGCGKSMGAKAIAAAWELPLVRMDMSLVLSGSFGTPEYAFEHATRMAEEVAPIVLWVDEIENSFGYDEQTGGGGGNVNIFSSFLTWLQEKNPRVFVAATANRIQSLPAELMRKGRFDQLFFLDLPNKDERKEIFRIHIAINGGNPRSSTSAIWPPAPRTGAAPRSNRRSSRPASTPISKTAASTNATWSTTSSPPSRCRAPWSSRSRPSRTGATSARSPRRDQKSHYHHLRRPQPGTVRPGHGPG